MQVIVDGNEIDCTLVAATAEEFSAAFDAFAVSNGRWVVAADVSSWPFTATFRTDDLKSRVRSIGSKLAALTGPFSLEHLDCAASLRGADLTTTTAKKIDAIFEAWSVVFDATGCLRGLGVKGLEETEKLAEDVAASLEALGGQELPAADIIESLGEKASKWHDAVEAAKRGGAWE